MIVRLYHCLIVWMYDCTITSSKGISEGSGRGRMDQGTPQSCMQRRLWLHVFLIVWLCDCMIVWLYDCMIAWFYDCMIDCMIAWLCDCMILSLHDCTIVWLHDSLIAWLCDCIIFWLCDCTIVWLYDFLIVWLHDYTITSIVKELCEKTTAKSIQWYKYSMPMLQCYSKLEVRNHELYPQRS